MPKIPEDIKNLAKQGWLPFFRSGDYGEKGNWSPERVHRTAEVYDPEFNYAPLVIGHPHDNSPAYGRAKELHAVDSVGPSGEPATYLLAMPEKVDPTFTQAVLDGNFDRLSAAFYNHGQIKGIPEDADYLRHIGFFGAGGVEVKGMPAPSIALASGFMEGKEFEEFPAEELGLEDVDFPAFFEKAPPEAGWDFSSADYDIKQLVRASAVVDGISGNPHTAPAKGGVTLTKGDCHLPHHKPDGTLVWHGIANAMARLNQMKVGTELKNKAFSHLKKHYSDYGKEVPEKKFDEFNHPADGGDKGGKTMDFAKLLASFVGALPEDTAKAVFNELTQKLAPQPRQGGAGELAPPEAGKEGEKPESKPQPARQFGEDYVDTKVAERVTAELSIINKVNKFGEMAKTRVPAPSLNGLKATYEGLLRREQTPEFAEAEKKEVPQPGQPPKKRPSEEFAEGIKGMVEIVNFGEVIPPDAKGADAQTEQDEAVQAVADAANRTEATKKKED